MTPLWWQCSTVHYSCRYNQCICKDERSEVAREETIVGMKLGRRRGLDALSHFCR